MSNFDGLSKGQARDRVKKLKQVRVWAENTPSKVRSKVFWLIDEVYRLESQVEFFKLALLRASESPSSPEGPPSSPLVGE